MGQRRFHQGRRRRAHGQSGFFPKRIRHRLPTRYLRFRPRAQAHQRAADAGHRPAFRRRLPARAVEVNVRHPASSASLAALALGVAWCNAAAAPREGAREDAAQKDVAIVEDVSPGVGDLRRFDLIAAGGAAELGRDGRIVLGYLQSCWQDSIAGGRAVVEPLKSRVEGGALTRRRVECDAAGLARMNSAGLAARGGGALAGPALPEPDVNLYGLSPIVMAARPGLLVIERIDTAAPQLKFSIAEKGVDLRHKDVALEPSGLYRFTFGQAAIVVRIDSLAEPGGAPAVGRLVIFR